MSNMIQKDISFSLKLQMVHTKMNSNFNLYTCLQPHLYIKIHVSHTHTRTRKC